MVLFDNIVIIGNPVAGGGSKKKILHALDIFKEKGFSVELLLTEKKGDAELFAKKLTNKLSTLVIAAGGDGTYNEVANGLVNSNTTMAILPVGTTSVLAKELKMPYKIPRAIDFILNGKEQIVHLGLIKSLNKPDYKKYFLLMTGIGFDAEAVFGVNEKIKKYTGKGGYILSGLNVLLKYNPRLIEITLYDEEIIKKSTSESFLHDNHLNQKALSLQGYLAIIGKAASYGGDFKITPHARLTEPVFYIFISHSKSRTSVIKHFAGIATGMHLRYSDISYIKAAKVRISGNSRVQIDGDYFGTTPVIVEVAPNSLKLIMRSY